MLSQDPMHEAPLGFLEMPQERLPTLWSHSPNLAIAAHTSNRTQNDLGKCSCNTLHIASIQGLEGHIYYGFGDLISYQSAVP